jgi:peptidoglycan/LPS O-acetylase OafA/YrhL
MHSVSKKNPILNYRPDIDGLRAIAILTVVFFHYFKELVPSGFVGVDVFFVISGYLISGIIFQNLQQNKFSVVDFYFRRIKRIFPALALVLFSVLLIENYVLFPDEMNQLSKHIFAGTTFISNFVLWKEDGYFDIQSDLKPLLHLWSLGVEEQFYMIWPVIL